MKVYLSISIHVHVLRSNVEIHLINLYLENKSEIALRIKYKRRHIYLNLKVCTYVDVYANSLIK